MAHTENKEAVNYFNVLADGKFHQTVEQGTEGAVHRTYETSDGKTGEKWEKVYSDVSGMITNIEFADGNYGKLLMITISDDGYEPVVVSLNCNSNFGEDMLHKLLNIDQKLPVKLIPYSFTDDKGKNRKGITVMQGDIKVQSHFKQYSEDTKEFTYTAGFPEAPKDKGNKKPSSDQWKVWYANCRLFMIDYIETKLGLDNSKDAEAAANKAFDGE